MKIKKAKKISLTPLFYKEANDSNVQTYTTTTTSFIRGRKPKKGRLAEVRMREREIRRGRGYTIIKAR